MSSRPNSQNTLVMGLAAGYHYGDVRPFLTSLYATGFAGTCVLFTTETTRATERMAAHGAQVVPFTRQPGREHLSHNAYRYFLYQDYLRDCGRTFDRILLTDVRDVLFQADPTAHRWPRGLNVTLEDRRMTVGKCPFNSLWVRHHLGEDALAAIADRPISCSGTTVGDHPAITAYLDALTGLLEPYEPGEMTAGYDQGVHNHLLHSWLRPNGRRRNELLQRRLLHGWQTGDEAQTGSDERTGKSDQSGQTRTEVTAHDNTGPILTLAYRKGEPQTNEQGRVLNDAGEPAVIVHQYDRKPQLFKSIREKYA